MLLNPFRFSAEGAPEADPHWASVFSLVHFDGADGSTTLTCQKGVSYLRTGNPIISSSSALYGIGGGKFFGTNGRMLWQAAYAEGTLSSVYTLEAMVRFADNAQDWIPFSFDQGSNSVIPYLQGGVIKVRCFGGVITGVTPVSPGEWVHIAVVKTGGNIYLFVKGYLQGSKPDTGTAWKYSLTLGGAPAYYGQVRNMNGDMDEFRVTDGVARYTANFTPPSAPFPNS